MSANQKQNPTVVGIYGTKKRFSLRANFIVNYENGFPYRFLELPLTSVFGNILVGFHNNGDDRHSLFEIMLEKIFDSLKVTSMCTKMTVGFRIQSSHSIAENSGEDLGKDRDPFVL